MLWPSGIGWKVLDLETVAAWKKYSGRFQTLKNTLQSGQITNVVNHSYKYTPVIQLLEIHPFSSQHGDVSMKLYPCSSEPGQEVTIAGYSGSGQSKAGLNVLTCLLQGLAVGSVGQYWPGGTVTRGYGGSNISQLCGGLPATELTKLSVMDTDLPLSSQWDYFLQKNYLSLLKFEATLQPADTAPMLFNCPRSFHPHHLTVWWKMSFHQVSVNLSGEWASVWYFDTQKLQAGKQNQG